MTLRPDPISFFHHSRELEPENIEPGSGVVEKQPIRDKNQITNPDEISSGDLIREHNRHDEQVFEVWRPPFIEEADSQPQIATLPLSWGLEDEWLCGKYLSDNAVVAYDNGKWNRFNWFERMQFEAGVGFRLRSYDQANLLAPTAKAMLQRLGVHDQSEPYLKQFYVIEPSAVLAMTVEQINELGKPIHHRLELHAYYRGERRSEEWLHAGPEKEAYFNHFESAEINREDEKVVEITTRWEEMKGESESHTFTFGEPALEMDII